MLNFLRKKQKYFDDQEEEKIYYSRWETENTLINQRLTWLLVSQGLLFGAYGTIGTKSIDACKEKSEFLIEILAAISKAGGVFSVVILVGILAAIFAQIKLHCIYKPKGSTIGVSTFTTIIGWATCLAAPAIFMYAWHVIPEPKPISDRNVACYELSAANIVEKGAIVNEGAGQKRK